MSIARPIVQFSADHDSASGRMKQTLLDRLSKSRQAASVIETQTAVRTRTYSWTDPAVNAAELGRRSGLELLQAMARGEVPPPPIMHTLGMEGIEVLDGGIVFSLYPQEFHYNPLGTVHGGVLSTIMDSATGCAVHTTLPAGWGYTSLDLTSKFLRAVTVDSGLLRCEGSVISRGRTTALAEARLYDGAGKLVAYASSTCLIFEIPA
jgi:uncharacterized protein (TIGR00369 family)